jgi:trk system potassium uptake protein TrkA
MRRQEFAVIGLGRFGISLARTLVQQGHTVLGIDHDQALVQRYSHELTQTVALDSTDEEALKEIGVEDYPKVVVAIGDDFEASLMTCVALKTLGVRHVVCKASTTTHRDILHKVGVDRVVLPEYEGGERTANELANPHLVERINLGPDSAIAEVRVPQSMVGSTLEELDLPNDLGLCVLAFVRRGNVSVPPPQHELLREGDLLVVFGKVAATQRLISHA